MDNKALSANEQIKLNDALTKAIDHICRDMKCPYDVFVYDINMGKDCNDYCQGHTMNECWRKYFMENS